jgi:hypothetical protein
VKGGGVAALDYDGDGWVDLAFSRGSSLDRWRKGENPGPVLYRNRGDGTFEDVSRKAGLTRGGWGVGLSAADYDNDGRVDLYLTNLGPDVLYRNNGDGTFTDVTEKAGIVAPGWSSSAAFGDFDGDGLLDLYVAGYLDVGPDKLPEGRAGGTCAYLGVGVLCGPRGLPGAEDHYFRNNGDGTFAERSEASGAVDKERYFGLGVVAADLDGDLDLDVAVAAFLPDPDRARGTFASLVWLERQRDASFARHTLQAGQLSHTTLDVGDFDDDGDTDIVAGNFVGFTFARMDPGFRADGWVELWENGGARPPM